MKTTPTINTPLAADRLHWQSTHGRTYGRGNRAARRAGLTVPDSLAGGAGGLALRPRGNPWACAQMGSNWTLPQWRQRVAASFAAWIA